MIVGGARENRDVTIAVGRPVEAMSDCLDSLRETLSGLDDKEITQALRDIEMLSRRAYGVMCAGFRSPPVADYRPPPAGLFGPRRATT
jgi:hypothetical protein